MTKRKMIEQNIFKLKDPLYIHKFTNYAIDDHKYLMNQIPSLQMSWTIAGCQIEYFPFY